MKKFSLLLFLACLTVLLAACGGRKTGSAAASAPASTPASTSAAAAPTPAPTSEPLVEQEACGIRFLLPESIAATRRTSGDETLTRYYLNGSDSASPLVQFDISTLDDLPAVETWTDWQFAAFASGLAGDEGTLLQKGEVSLNPSAPIHALYVKFQRPIDGIDYYFETAYFSNVSVYMIWEADYDNPYTDIWEAMLNSIEIVEPPAENAAPAASGIRPEFKEMMDSYEAFFDEYIAFMEKYRNADGTAALSMLSDLSSYMTKYADYMARLNAVDQDELSTEEALYYLEVATRINQKLIGTLQ